MVAAPDGRWLASGSFDGTVCIWDAAAGRKRATLTGHSGGVAALAVAPDGSWLASAGYASTVYVWDAELVCKRAELPTRLGGWALAVAPDGRWLASGSDDGTIRVWDVASARTLALMRMDSRIHAIAWLPADTLAVGGSAGLYQFSFLAGDSPASVVQRGHSIP
jgi:WD40 repeat protein